MFIMEQCCNFNRFGAASNFIVACSAQSINIVSILSI